MAWTPDDGLKPASLWLLLAALLGYAALAVGLGILVISTFRWMT